jgi:Protein of unknown function (DUF1604)
MASDSEGEDYVYYGTPLEQEQASSYYARSAGAQDVAKTIAVPVHQQQVRDEQGRQRLHGAFTGGFSAGYYNSVGSQVRICVPCATALGPKVLAVLNSLGHVHLLQLGLNSQLRCWYSQLLFNWALSA